MSPFVRKNIIHRYQIFAHFMVFWEFSNFIPWHILATLPNLHTQTHTLAPLTGHKEFPQKHSQISSRWVLSLIISFIIYLDFMISFPSEPCCIIIYTISTTANHLLEVGDLVGFPRLPDSHDHNDYHVVHIIPKQSGQKCTVGYSSQNGFLLAGAIRRSFKGDPLATFA